MTLYISEILYPLKSAIKPMKQTRFAGDPVTSVKTIPVRRTRSHPPKWTINAGDPNLLIPIDLLQARAEINLSQDLGGNLSVMSPRESHHTEETLPTVPLGQFQAQGSDNTITNNIVHSDLPDEQELDWKRQMVSPVAPQRSQTVSRKQQEKHGLKLSRDGLKHQ